METDEGEGVIPFQLEFDKPIGAKIKIAEWNPEKDLLAIVTDDSKLLLHRFNWQRLWTITLGKCITSLCWRPDGKAVAVGLHDGTISLHDVENGKLLRTLKLHSVDVMCLNWEVDERAAADDSCNIIAYEDRTSRFFPPPPRAPKMPGLVPADGGFADDGENSFQELSNSFCQHFSILCSADKDGDICFSIFGIFPIGKVNIHNPKICSQLRDGNATMQLLDASIVKVVLSKDLCQLIVLCTGKLSDKGCESAESRTRGFPSHGFYALVLDTSIFCKRKYELYQVAQQASNIEDLTEVIQESLSVMLKQWADAIHMFREKFSSLTSLISDHGLDSTPQEEFLSLLGGARTSPAIHQFLVNSLGEAGIKRVSKVVCGAGKELQLIVLDHLQPAAEMIGFRMGELRGLSRWRARFRGIGLEEKFINIASEKAGMLIVHGERFLLVLSSVLQLFTNFFNWLLKSVKILMTEPTDQLLPFSSELVIVFVKFLYDQDPISLLLEFSEANRNVEVDLETLQRIRELIHFGGFSDTEYLNRTLAEGFLQMKYCFKEAFDLPFATISQKIICQDVLPLFPIGYSNNQESYNLPVSASYYVEDSDAAMRRRMIGYISFQIPDGCFTRSTNCICIAKGFSHDFENTASSQTSLEAALLSVPDGYDCVDLSLYKEGQIVMLLNRTATDSESSGKACILLIDAGNLPFISISSPSHLSSWKLDELKESVVQLVLENEKVRAIPHSVVSPLAVSATRGLACVFAAKKRALVYILDEEEEEEEEEEEDDEGNLEME